MRTGRMFAVLLFLVLVLGSVSSESAAGQPGAVANLDDGTWQIQTVDQGPVNAYMSGGSLLALDSAGRPHIGYAQYNEAFLLHCSIKYAWHDGVGWHLETVDDSGACEGYVSLALSRDDQPRLSYSCYSVVKYAWRDGDGWHVETAASGEVRGASLALDGSDRPRISYYDYLDMSVKYAEYDGVSWQISSVADGFQIFFPATALALDGAGHPHISYVPYVGGDCDLGYAWHDGTSWHTEVLGQHLPPGSRTSLAVDGLGRPCISYVVMAESGSVGELRYARREGAAWHITTLRSIENYGDTALRFDQAGRPHIAYATAYDALKYTWYDGVSWPVEDIDNEQGFPGGISLALDETGRPQVAWYDGSYASVVKYAQRSAPPAPP
ncbi:MAG: hypothetical protein KJ734_06970, partial [Chloroflexi bacterium]|nr:hypothetical protein [Chloroflexota bacterium]